MLRVAARERGYYWGPDLSESVDGAAGAMGLVMIEDWNGGDSGSYFPAYDHSGNLVGLIDQGGNWDAWYEYDAYGNVVNYGGTYADENPIGFGLPGGPGSDVSSLRSSVPRSTPTARRIWSTSASATTPRRWAASSPATPSARPAG